jgi:uncharacterized protein (DUF305 family)
VLSRRLLAVGLIVTCAVLAGCDDPSAAPSVVRPGAPDFGRPVSPDSGTSSSPARPGEPAAGRDPDDVAFLRDMMVHHSQAIVMAEWARTRARNPSVRALAERIRVGQQPEIDAMRATLTGWGEPAPDLAHARHEDHTGMPGMASPAELAALERSTGTAFDAMFLRLMIRHHQGAVTMSRTVADTGQDLRTGDLAQEIGITQTKEIATMRKLQGTL